MLERKILTQLIKWKNDKNHKSLIINGQRQIGKTYIINDVFSKQYESYIYFNFVSDKDAKDIFTGNLDVNTLLTNISFYNSNAKFIEGKTLFFFDEVQDCPQAIESLKFWTQDGRFDVIVAGSALGMTYKEETKDISYPVGYVNTMKMYSLDFEEFLWAMGINKIAINDLKICFEKLQKVSISVDRKMRELLQLYMVIGGMPEAINTYLKTNNIAEVHKIHQELLQDYKNHIAAYASVNNKIKARKCYESIPFQLVKDNHKYQYSVIEKKSTATKFRNSIDWLEQQLLVTRVIGLKKIDYPFEGFSDDTNFRIYPTDIGMLIAMYDISLKRALIEDKELEKKVINLILGTAKGGLYEALAADILYKNGHEKLYFYKNEKNTSEIEFLIIRDDSICPIEIKAGKEKANSLANILATNTNIKVGYKMSSQNVGKSDKMIILPLYMLMFM